MPKKVEREILVVVSKVKAFIRSKNCQSASDLPEALSAHVHTILKRACERAKANGRVTVRTQDL
jgi:histone H3/H4